MTTCANSKMTVIISFPDLLHGHRTKFGSILNRFTVFGFELFIEIGMFVDVNN